MSMSMLDGEFTEQFARTTNPTPSEFGSTEEEELSLDQLTITPSPSRRQMSSEVIITTEYVTAASLRAEEDKMKPPSHAQPTKTTTAGTVSGPYYTPGYSIQQTLWGTAISQSISDATSTTEDSSGEDTVSAGDTNAMVTAADHFTVVPTSMSPRTQAGNSTKTPYQLSQGFRDSFTTQKQLREMASELVNMGPGHSEQPKLAVALTSESSTITASQNRTTDTAINYRAQSSLQRDDATITTPTTVDIAPELPAASSSKQEEPVLSPSSGSTSTGAITITQVHDKEQLLRKADRYRDEARQLYEDCIKLKLARAQALLDGGRVRALELYFEIQEMEKSFAQLDRKAKQYYFRGASQRSNSLFGTSYVFFAAHNPESLIGEIDVHGLKVEEAITETEKAVKQVHQSGQRKLRVITGWGKHSKPQGAAVLRSRILERLSIE
jgi:hypothetical protein